MLVPIGEDFGDFEVEENDWPGQDFKFDYLKPLWKGQKSIFCSDRERLQINLRAF